MQIQSKVTNDQLKHWICCFGHEYKNWDALPEVCILVEYDYEIGKVDPPRWEAKYFVFHCVRYVVNAFDMLRVGQLQEISIKGRKSAEYEEGFYDALQEVKAMLINQSI